eukprot:4783785-Pyramimonas_sp.AAC.1
MSLRGRLAKILFAIDFLPRQGRTVFLVRRRCTVASFVADYKRASLMADYLRTYYVCGGL